MFFACSPDQCLFGDTDLSVLLALIRDVCDAPAEDVCVWHRNQVVCVVASGRVVWLRPEFKPATVAA